MGLDLAIAPGITKYPDLTSVGFPSVLAANGLSRMPMIEFDQTYTNLFDQCCVDTHFSHQLSDLFIGSVLGRRGRTP